MCHVTSSDVMSLTRMAHTAADSLGVMVEEEEVGDVTGGRADSTLSPAGPTPDLYTAAGTGTFYSNHWKYELLNSL